MIDDVRGVPLSARSSVDLIALAAVVLATIGQILLILVLPVFVTSDGAAHLGAAQTLVELWSGERVVTASTHLALLPATNLFPEIPAALLTAVAGGEAAEKVVLFAFVLLLPIALAYALDGVRPGAAWLSIFAAPVTFNVLLESGFNSFCFGIVGLLLAVGFLGHRARCLRWRHVAALVIGLALIYMTHAFAFALASAFVVVVAAWEWLVVGRPERQTRVVIGTGLAAIVIAGLAIVTASLGPPGPVGGLLAFQPRALAEAASLVLPLVAFDQREAAPALLVTGSMAALALIALRSRSRARAVPARHDGYLALAVLLLLGTLVIPDSTTLGVGGPGAFISSRLGLAFPFAVVLWLGGDVATPRVRIAVTLAMLGATVGIGILRFPVQQALSDEVVSLTRLEPCLGHGGTIAQVNLAGYPLPSRRTDQLAGEAGRVAARIDALDLGNPAIGDGVHLLRYDDAIDPYRYLRQRGSSPETIEPVIDPRAYSATGATLDAVILAGRPLATAAVLASAPWVTLRDQLERDYTEVAASADGWWEVYERNGSAAAADGNARRAVVSGCIAAR